MLPFGSKQALIFKSDAFGITVEFTGFRTTVTLSKSSPGIETFTCPF